MEQWSVSIVLNMLEYLKIFCLQQEGVYIIELFVQYTNNYYYVEAILKM